MNHLRQWWSNLQNEQKNSLVIQIIGIFVFAIWLFLFEPGPEPIAGIVMIVITFILTYLGPTLATVASTLVIVFMVLGGLLWSNLIIINHPMLNNTNPTIPTTFESRDGLVVIEAEHFTGQVPGSSKAADISWQPKQLPNSFGDGAIQALSEARTNKPINTGVKTYGPALYYEIQFNDAGNYVVHVRGQAPNETDTKGDHDSIHVGLAGDAVITGIEDDVSEGIGIGFDKDSFTWQHKFSVSEKDSQESNNTVEAVIDVPQPGIYLLFLWMREDGVAVDKIVLSESALDGSVMNELPETAQK